ncbi:MAG: cobyrinate a,c-diamide synthase [Mogibacterium sp.]|nr:cobyrinate a,c-diamide synthase [Mogibacterium sp.]
MTAGRVMIAAPKSGSGKTILTCGLLQILKEAGLEPAAYKCGPDYIDPMFHRTVLGVPGNNLDPFFSEPQELTEILTACTGRCAVLEGAMGIYDGITGGAFRKGSCYEVAAVTKTPILLVIDVKGMGMTMLSVIRGILADDEESLIRGILLNRVSEGFYRQICCPVEQLLTEISQMRGVPVELLGGIPVCPDLSLESRHLGLKRPEEIMGLRAQVAMSAEKIRQYCRVDRILGIMREAAELPAPAGTAARREAEARPSGDEKMLTLGVARDEAFCFYYEENLRMLREAGIRILEFSPVRDEALPEDLDGLLLGGGYPELSAAELSANTGMLASIRRAIASGMPSLAECGGFMLLQQAILDGDTRYPMAGVLEGDCANTGKLRRFGYITVHGNRPETLITGLSVRGHEFHYYDSTSNGTDARAEKPGGLSWDCIHAGPRHVWGFPHLWYPSCPALIRRFAEQMKAYHGERSK